MTSLADRSISTAVRESAHALTGSTEDFVPLMERIGDARFVLIGEASHGTHEFYRIRAAITNELIRSKGFSAVAVEADWPDAWRVSRYVRGQGNDADAEQALRGFQRFPQWMWRNADVLDFVRWLRDRNLKEDDDSVRAGFYGIDLYSLYESAESVLRYLDRVDPEAARRARYRYGCFEQFGEDSQAYGYVASFDLTRSCEDEAVRQLVELRQRAGELANRDGELAADAFFSAEQNARLVKNAEEYYRSMFRGRVSSWNLRDTHMAETLDQLAAHLERQGRAPKVVVWAHNSHLGDARATEMGRGGEINVGQLVRERYGRAVVNVGFTTYTGTVTAADDWGDPAKTTRVRPGLPGSYEALFHDVGVHRFLLDLRSGSAAALREPRLERAIGVIYRPETERMSHYFQARLADQFDAIIHFDETRAVEPLERVAILESEEPPETYPSAL